MTPEERLAARIVVLTDLDTGPGAALNHNGASSNKFR